LKRGSVLFWPSFTFDDGGTSNKLLVVVGQSPNDNMLMFKTTSQPKSYRPDPDGCHSDRSVHRFKQYLGGFRIPTWVQFDPPIIKHPNDAKAAGARVVFEMKPQDVQAVINCFKRSPEVSDILLHYCK
jgi:hypothetical protein